jgi:CheY-like chemotaxis protein
LIEYRLYFRGDADAIQARQGFFADSDDEACELAQILFDACHDKCSRYELWSGTRLIVESWEKAPSPPRFEFLTRNRQERVLDYEQRLRDSHWIVGKSQRLLEAIEAASKVRLGSANRQNRALIVEDDEPARKWMARVVRDAGFDVAEAGDFQCALRVIQDGNPLRLLVADIVLPTLSGLSLARMARMVHKELKTVYVTAYDLPREETIIGPVLRKPVPPHAFFDTVRAMLAA